MSSGKNQTDGNGHQHPNNTNNFNKLGIFLNLTFSIEPELKNRLMYACRLPELFTKPMHPVTLKSKPVKQTSRVLATVTVTRITQKQCKL